MKTFSLVLVMGLILQSCGGSKGGPSSQREGSESNPAQDSYTTEEMELGNKIALCLNNYKASSEEMKNNKFEHAKLVTIGMTGNECLHIKDPTKLEIIQLKYELHSHEIDTDWNLIAREILTKEVK